VRQEYHQARGFKEFLDGVEVHRELWSHIYRRARVPDDVLQAALSLPGRWHLLVMAEDWCGDAVHSVPYVARLTDLVPQLSMRVIGRDENPDLMDGHLTDGTRSIPVVMILDEDFREVGWWGPRPSPFRDLFHREIKPLPKPERFPRVRAWYAKDQGRTTLRELLALIPAHV